ncbi:ubiquitin carboxyl-terminal hydrolase 25-like [Papaver somniferum]|uniref:ubiquitin carboxyl-terminal hydrolase 25-like n=1 Tax=Papaver somniferum TaxID=3469 RepID=UPI000E700921|nr:ubiquitin carboxyl-terminal hydrolase 25-like [Papaver somniferum]
MNWREKLVSAKKQMSILQSPNILVIQLKRFEGIFGGKIDRKIAFEGGLMLSNYMCRESPANTPKFSDFFAASFILAKGIKASKFVCNAEKALKLIC